MNFVITTYVYPLSQPIELSKSLRIQLDNPRTKHEITLVEHYLVRAANSGEDYAIPLGSEKDIVAHGNFVNLNKYLSSLSKEEGQEEYFSDLITDLYSYVRAVVEEYLKDKQLVEYLKVN